MMLFSMLETVKLFLDATKAYAQMAYMAQKGHAKLAFTNSFSELDVSNLEISKLDISKIFSYRFCNPVSMDSLDGEGAALAWGLLHAPTLSLNPGSPYMHCMAWLI